MAPRSSFYLDLVERTAWTAMQAFLGVWLAMGGISADVWQAAAMAAAIAAAKALIAPQLPWTASGTASTLPARVEPPDPPHQSSAEEADITGGRASVRPPDLPGEQSET